MVNFYIVRALGKTWQFRNFALFWDCSKRPKSLISGNLSKNGYVWTTQWPTSSKLKIKFDPSLERPWLKFFRLEKILVQKIHHQGVIWVPTSRLMWENQLKKLTAVPSINIEVHEVLHTCILESASWLYCILCITNRQNEKV